MLSLIPSPALQTKRLAWTRGCSHLSPTKQNCIWYSNPATWEGTGRGFFSTEGKGGLGLLAPICLSVSLEEGAQEAAPEALRLQVKEFKTKEGKTQSTGPGQVFKFFFFLVMEPIFQTKS